MKLFEILIIVYALFNVLMFGLGSAVLGGSKHGFFKKLFLGLVILSLGFFLVVFYMLLPNRVTNRINAGLQRRSVKKSQKELAKNISVKRKADNSRVIKLMTPLKPDTE